MGLGKFLSKVANVVAPIAPIIGVVNPALGTALATTAGAFRRAPPGPVTPMPTAIQLATPAEMLVGAMPFRFTNGGVTPTPTPVPTAAGAPAAIGALGIRLLTQNAARAILKLAQIFGITVALPTLARVGRQLYRTMVAFTRRHPAISVLSMLTALGLTVQEAAEFMFWGQSTTRRRRRRGISGRDIAICRRTIRRMAAFRADLGSLGGGRRPSRRDGRGGVVVARAG